MGASSPNEAPIDRISKPFSGPCGTDTELAPAPPCEDRAVRRRIPANLAAALTVGTLVLASGCWPGRGRGRR